MPLLRRWENKGGLFAIWHVTESQDELKVLLETVPYIEEELSSFKSDSRRMEYLAVRVLLKEMTGCIYRILHHSSGKPYLEGESMKISVSHTKGFVAIGIHPHNEIGIDIEFLSDRVKKVVSKFVRDDEMSFLYNEESDMYTDKRYTDSLLLIWSAKETMYKMIDSSEVDFKYHLHIYPFELPLISDSYSFVSGKMYAQEYKTMNHNIFSIDYILSEEFVCTFSIAD